MQCHSLPARNGLTRRAFVQSTTVASIATLIRAAESATPAKNAKMKVGCLSWCFHNFAAGVDPSDAIDAIGALGFDGIELIANARTDLDTVWAGGSLDRIRARLERNKLQVSQFVLFQPVVSGLASPDKAVREQNVDHFEAGCRVAARLGAPLINIVAPWPTSYGADRGYLPRFYEMSSPGADARFHIDIGNDFDWEKNWREFVETTRACVQRAAAHKVHMTIEHHTHCLIHDATAFLRLWDAVRDPRLGYNLDTGWTLLQREYPPMAIHKVGPHLMNLHVRDIDGLMRRFPPAGSGVMDFKAVVEACRKVNYSGFFSIEQDKGSEDMHEVCKRYLRIMREAIG